MGVLGYSSFLVELSTMRGSHERRERLPFTIETTAPLPGKPIKRQWDFISSDCRAIKLICPRRVGKTVGIVKRTGKKSWEQAGRRTLYINHTLGNAKRQFFDPPGEASALGLLGTLDSHGIGYAANNTEVFVELENGSFVQGVGCDNMGEVKKKLGFYWHEIIIDEIQEYADELIDLLVKKTLAPTLIQTRGTLILSGTQPEVHAGLWWDTINNADYETFTWHMLDNPLITREAIIEEMGKAGFVVNFEEPEKNHPIVQREVFCIAAVDTSALMYEYLIGRNDWPAGGVPIADVSGQGKWRYSMGVDIGGAEEGNDKDACAVLGWRMDDPLHQIYEVEGWEEGQLDSEEFFARLFETFKRWQPMQALCGDTGGASKALKALSKRINGLEVTPKPSDLSFSQRLLNDDLRAGRMKLNPDGAIVKALKIAKRGHHEPDIAAASRYAHNGALHFLAKEPAKKEESYAEYLERNIRDRHRRQQAGLRGMWGAHARR